MNYKKISMTETELIDSIPRFECSDGRELRYGDEFFKDKLKNALINRDIICLARGEGRSNVLNDIVFHPEILFDWGEKSIHAFLQKKDEKMRRFCDPDNVDKDTMIYYIKKYGERLKVYYRRYKHFKCTEYDVDIWMKKLIENINWELDYEKLLCVKEWLVCALHTMGEKEFKQITPNISCSYGENRFDIACRFGRGYENNYFVVMDSWVNAREEGMSYKKTEYVNAILEQYDLRWFSNKNNEIMLKYCIFPQQLVGYYFYDRECLQKYVINKHYVDEWEENTDFEIGSFIYFEQIVDFEKLGPYNTVYEYNGKSFSIAGRRKG